MFIIEPKDPKFIAEAMFILSHFHVKATPYSDAVDTKGVFIEVDDEGREGDLRLAEMTFQMHWHQKKDFICTLCLERIHQGDIPDVCGHLTFTHPIEPAF